MLRLPGRTALVMTLSDDDTDEPYFFGGPTDDAPLVTVFGATDQPPPKGAAREKWARQAVIDGWAKAHPGYAPSLAELQAVQAVSRLESGYGSWGNHPKCGNNGVGSNNWGSTQYPKLPKDGGCPDGTFLCEDYDAKHDHHYKVCFYKYATPADGAASVVRNMTAPVRKKTGEAIKTGDAEAISTAMYYEHYYGGFGKTDAERIEGHVKALTGAAQKIATALGEPLAVVRGGTSQGGSSSDGEGFWTPGKTIVALAAVAAGGAYLYARR